MIFGLLIANLIMGFAFIFRLGSLPPQIPLFYSRPPGDLQLADWWFIFLLPLLLNFFFVLDTLFYRKYFTDNDFIAHVTYYFKIFLLVSFTYIFLKIIFLVT